jgi:hypothetical protein
MNLQGLKIKIKCENPKGPYRNISAGSWFYFPHAGLRNFVNPGYRNIDYGFRFNLKTLS